MNIFMLVTQSRAITQTIAIILSVFVLLLYYYEYTVASVFLFLLAVIIYTLPDMANRFIGVQVL